MSEKLEELISLLYQDKLTQYGKRLLVENIEKLQKENGELREKVKQLEEENKTFHNYIHLYLLLFFYILLLCHFWLLFDIY